MEILHPLAEQYALKHSSSMDALLDRIHVHTLETHAESHMISGPLQGQLLSMISKMIRPKKILEIGTFTGYSALCLATGLEPGGMLHTIEAREEDATTAAKFFETSPYASRIQVHVGDAHTLLKELNEQWELVFVDADKTGYIDYYEQLMDIVRPGTWLIFDNMFFHGEVLKEDIKGKNAKAIHEFNIHVRNDDRTDNTMVTVRDGLMLIQKR
jgi:predicted O-methyltransferase YrrM